MADTAKLFLPLGLDGTRRLISALCFLLWTAALAGLLAYLSQSFVPFWVIGIMMILAQMGLYGSSLVSGGESSSSSSKLQEFAASAAKRDMPPLFVNVQS